MDNISKIDCVEGHFWVKRNNKIIDNDMWIKYRLKHIGKHIKHYVEAPIDIQKYMIDTYINKNEEAFITFVYLENYIPILGLCNLNAFVEQYKNGGKIIFGSMGYSTKTKPHIKWIYGNSRKKTIDEFISNSFNII
jgi:hypothetical protein